jgi:hypothetical protein
MGGGPGKICLEFGDGMYYICHMRTSMNIPKDLLKEAIELSGASSQTMAVVLGLQELIKKKRLERLAAKQGSGAISLTMEELSRMRSR